MSTGVRKASPNGKTPTVSVRGSQRPPKQFAEFFAGIGLAGEALKQSGWSFVYANDIDPKKFEIFAANHADSDCFQIEDIWNTDNIVDRLGKSPILATATFPCIDLSLAGNWKGFEGSHSSTFFGFVEVLKSLGEQGPKIILVENVTGFLSSQGGKDFQTAVTALSDLGFWMDAFVLDAKMFVPQSRQRVFLVAIHKSIDSPLLVRQQGSGQLVDLWSAALEDGGTVRPKALLELMRRTPLATGWVATPIRQPEKNAYCLSEVLDQDEDQEWWSKAEVDKHYDKLSDLHRRRIDELLRSKTHYIATGYRRKRDGSTKLEVRFDGLAGCLRTPRGGSARQIVVMTSNGKLKIRWMSPIEYARLQGAGQYTMLPNDRQMLFGFGDAVCVPVIAWIDTCVLSPLYETFVPFKKRR